MKEHLPSHSKNGLLVHNSCEISTGPEAWIKPAIEAKTQTDPVRVFVSIESVLMRESGKGQERVLQVMKVHCVHEKLISDKYVYCMVNVLCSTYAEKGSSHLLSLLVAQ